MPELGPPTSGCPCSGFEILALHFWRPVLSQKAAGLDLKVAERSRQGEPGVCRPRPTVFKAWPLLALLCKLSWAANVGQEGRVYGHLSSLILLARGALGTSQGVTANEPDPRERRHDQGRVEGASTWSWGRLCSTPFLPPPLASFLLLFRPS